MNNLRKIMDITFWKFVFVGIVNTIFGTTIMFFSYNILHFSYWVSSALNYILASILSYILNKHFTFQNKSKSKKVIVRFAINITVCYLIAYGCARPIVRLLISAVPKNIQDNLAMLTGMVVFVILNYLGQRFWAFKKE